MLRKSNLFSGLWRHKGVSLESLKCQNSSAAFAQTKESSKSSSQSVADIIEEEEQEVLSKKWSKKKLPARLPLAKNFFVGLVDRELLAFPEVVTREEMFDLQNELLPLQNYFSDNLVQSLFKRKTKLEKNEQNHFQDIENNLKQLNLFGLNVSSEYDCGKGWGYSASLMASEPECRIAALGIGLASHRAIIDVLQKLGTQEQRDYFLPLLANGKLTNNLINNSFFI